jgi:hypothetical protein
MTDVIPEVDFFRAIPNPFAGLIGPSYRIYSHGEGSDRRAYSVISVLRRALRGHGLRRRFVVRRVWR